MLREISAFVTAIASMIDGLAARAAAVSALLRDPATSFVLVSSPRREAVEEAIAFAAELEPRAAARSSALVVNRVHAAADAPATPTLGELDALLGARLAGARRATASPSSARCAAADGAGARAAARRVPRRSTRSSSPSCRSRCTTSTACGGSPRRLGYRVSSSSEASPSAAQ